MKLYEKHFNNIKNKNKRIEVRLFDDKRQKLKVGDMITFIKLPDKDEKITVKVKGLSIFGNFYDFYSTFDAELFAHPKDITVEEQIERERAIYSEADEKKHGVLGIHLEFISHKDLKKEIGL